MAVNAAMHVRYALLLSVALNLALIVARVLLYMPLLTQRNAPLFVLEPIVLLLIYAAIAFAMTAKHDERWHTVLRTGTVIGLMTGTMWVVNLSLETLSRFSGIAATAPFLLGAFILWGVAGGIGAWRTEAAFSGIAAAIMAAMICVLITVAYGFLLTYTSLPRLERDLASSPEFLRSGWDDLRAFAIANTFDSGFSHLLGALIVSTIFGAIGSGVGLLLNRGIQRRTSLISTTDA
jgi:hypothetical protein